MKKILLFQLIFAFFTILLKFGWQVLARGKIGTISAILGKSYLVSQTKYAANEGMDSYR